MMPMDKTRPASVELRSSNQGDKVKFMDEKQCYRDIKQRSEEMYLSMNNDLV